jgi:mono/diheme cytochrome c family protein
MFSYKHLIYGLAGTIYLAFSGAGFAQTATPEMLNIGEEQFNENCAVCHQEDAIGEPGVAPSLTNPELLRNSSDKFFMGTIRDGREDTGMPPFEHLGRKNVRAIVAFLRGRGSRLSAGRTR